MLANPQSIVKIEALALAGAELYTELSLRKVMDTSTARKIAKPIKRQKFVLPSGTRATWDRFGRPHVVPEWHTHSPNETFLNALHFRISIVKVCFRVLLVELTSSREQCHAVDKATPDHIMRAAESYLATMQKQYRKFHGLATPRGWSFRADENAAFRNRDVSPIQRSTCMSPSPKMLTHPHAAYCRRPLSADLLCVES